MSWRSVCAECKVHVEVHLGHSFSAGLLLFCREKERKALCEKQVSSASVGALSSEPRWLAQLSVLAGSAITALSAVSQEEGEGNKVEV